ALASQISQRFAQPVAAPAGDAAFQRRERRVESRLARGAALWIVDSLRYRRRVPKSNSAICREKECRMETSKHFPLRGFEKHRMEGLIDGIFAVALTLLVL